MTHWSNVFLSLQRQTVITGRKGKVRWCCNFDLFFLVRKIVELAFLSTCLILRFICAGDFSSTEGSSGWTDASIGSQGWVLHKNETAKGTTQGTPLFTIGCGYVIT